MNTYSKTIDLRGIKIMEKGKDNKIWTKAFQQKHFDALKVLEAWAELSKMYFVNERNMTYICCSRIFLDRSLSTSCWYLVDPAPPPDITSSLSPNNERPALTPLFPRGSKVWLTGAGKLLVFFLRTWHVYCCCRRRLVVCCTGGTAGMLIQQVCVRRPWPPPR